MFSVLWKFLIHVCWVFLVFLMFLLASFHIFTIFLSQLAHQFSNLANLFNLFLKFLFVCLSVSKTLFFIYRGYISFFFISSYSLCMYPSLGLFFLFFSPLNNFTLRYFRFFFQILPSSQEILY